MQTNLLRSPLRTGFDHGDIIYPWFDIKQWMFYKIVFTLSITSCFRNILFNTLSISLVVVIARSKTKFKTNNVRFV